MAWKFNPAAWTGGSGGTVPQVSDYQNIAADIATQGGNNNAAGYGRTNVGYMGFLGGALPGTTYTVTAATWTTGTTPYVTLTIGTHNIAAGQVIGISGITPTGYNISGATIQVSAIGSTTIQFPLATNPGTYTSGGTVTVSGVAPFLNQIAVDQSNNLQLWNGTAWQLLTGLQLVSNNLTLPNNLTVDNALSVLGNSTLSGTLGVTGAVTLSAALSVGTNQTIGGTLGVTGAATLSSTLGVTGNATLGGTLAVAGNATVSTGNLTVSTGNLTLTTGYLSMPNQPHVKVRRASALNIATSTATAIPWDTDVVNGQGMHSTSTNPQNLIAVQAGDHVITGSIELAANSSGDRYLEVWVGNAANSYTATDTGFRCKCPLTGDNVAVFNFTCVVPGMAINDFLQVIIYQTSGSSLALTTGIYSSCSMYKFN